ncbi:flagellar hook-associated protein 3 [Roseateles sp. DAIF2]|uniref:flagellar hook-associated protein FlgL n=1 Tax=Roseateles sp. DAIF2 TaxID=2714952 RepID=UPI0018A32B72|nr:flagellar hook-associated protein FlgL [Roseateles sp. DAIF2]QPF73145.1 flagellar hook-associated protein 3 [Roseateles sp. DAIF2]
MRIATANMFDASIATLQRRQEQMQDSQQRLTSGKRIQNASDDPTGASRAERALSSIGRIDANQRALEASRNSMTLTEGALGDANEILQQIRDTMVSAGNASFSDTERKGLADKIVGLRDQLLAIANRPDGGGGFLFGGQGSANPPFLDQPGGVGYTGIPGQIQTGNIDDFPLSMDGRAAWEQARSGNGTFVTEPMPNSITGAPAKSWIDAGRITNPSLLTGNNYQVQVSGSGAGATYTVTNTTTGAVVASAPFASGKAIEFDGIAVTLAGNAEDGDQFSVAASQAGLKVFDVLDRAAAELRTPLRSNIQIAQGNSGRIRDLDSVIGNMQNMRSQVGEQMNNLDGTESRMADLKLYNQSEQSAAEDLDMVQGISDFQNQQSGYDAALKTYAMVQRMSLFQYINT